MLLGLLRSSGAPRSELVESIALAIGPMTDSLERVDLTLAINLLNCAADAFDDPLFGARLGSSHHPGMLGLLDYLFLTASTLGDAFEVVTKYGSVAAAYGEYDLTELEGEPAVRRKLPGGRDFYQAETFIVSWQLTMARQATGRPLRNVRVGMAQPAPENPRALVDILAVREVEFGRAACTITFTRPDLGLRLLSADPLLAGALRRHADLRRPATEPWPDRVQSFLAKGFDGRSVSLDSAAADMAISPRTLQHHLHSAKTSWRNEVALARDELAVSLLRTTTFSVAAIARHLGYSDARAFRRSFIKKHHSSPDQYRRNSSLA